MRRWFLGYHSPDQRLLERLKVELERKDRAKRRASSSGKLSAEGGAAARRLRLRAFIGVLAFAIAAGLIGWVDKDYPQFRQFFTIPSYDQTQVRPYVLTGEAERALKPGDSFRECAKDCPEMVIVPAGEFMMGSPRSEKGRSDDEDDGNSRQHKVVFAKPVAVSKFEATFDEWDACVADGECNPHVGDGGFGRGQNPVINVTWGDVQRYVGWLSKMTDKPYRLLSEAEWEYAARAGTQTAYSWGNGIGKGNANNNGLGTTPVGSFAPSAFGLHDMHGNVWEWVEDCYHDNYNGASANGSAWRTGDRPRTGNCSRRVVRGGSWLNDPENLRSANRSWFAPNSRDNHLGFRVGRSLLIRP